MKEATYLGKLRQLSPQEGSFRLHDAWQRVVQRHLRATRRHGRSSFGQDVIRAGIPVPPALYFALCGSIGLFLSVMAAPHGPLFAAVLGGSLAVELITSIPRDWAARRERSIAGQLPLAAEGLGQRIRIGVPFETALAYTTQTLPAGPLAHELSHLLGEIQRGIEPAKAVLELGTRLQGPEARMFVATLSMYCLGGNQLGEPLIRFAEFVRRHRIAMDAIARRIGMFRKVFGVVFACLALTTAFIAHALPVDVAAVQSPFGSLLREIGGVIVVFSLVIVMRLTASRNWEVDDV